jgi:hypothetical protein
MKLLHRWLGLLGTLLVLGLLTAQAQDKKDAKKNEPAKKDDKAEAKKPEAPKPAAPAFKDANLADEKDQLNRQELTELRRLCSGQSDALTGDRRKQLMEKATRWYLYRLTSPDVQAGRDGTVSEIMLEVLGGAGDNPRSNFFPTISRAPDPDAEEISRRGRQMDYLNTLRPIVVAHAQRVLETNEIIARLNAMRVLHRLAEFGLEAGVGEAFARHIENPAEHDAVRLWAFHGIAALNIKDPARAELCLLATCKWLEARTKMEPAAVSQMSEEERDGVSYVRRAAIRALGNSRRPIAKDTKDAREGPIAQLLVKLVATEEGSLASPPPTWMEGVEAAYAICQLNPKLSPSYQADYAVHQVARFVAALGSAAAEDATRERQRWRYFGYHLHTGTELLDKSNEHVRKAIEKMAPVFENLQDNTKNLQSSQELFRWVNATAPKGTAVYNPPL